MFSFIVKFIFTDVSSQYKDKKKLRAELSKCNDITASKYGVASRVLKEKINITSLEYS